MPPAQPARLHDEHAPLNQPLPEPGTASLFSVRGVGYGLTDLLKRKWFVPLCILIAAAVVWWWPQGWGVSWFEEPAPSSVQVPVSVMPPAMSEEEPVSSLDEGVSPVDAGVGTGSELATEVAASSPASAVALDAAASEAPAASAVPVVVAPPVSLIVVSATEPSWVDLTEARSGRKLFSRLVQAGEAIELGGELPIDAVIGNANGVQIRLRGEVVDLSPHVRNNVARLNLR